MLPISLARVSVRTIAYFREVHSDHSSFFAIRSISERGRGAHAEKPNEQFVILIAMAAMCEEKVTEKCEDYKQTHDLEEIRPPSIWVRYFLLADIQQFHGYFPAEAVHRWGPTEWGSM